MTEYANKTRQQNESRTLSANPRSSHQASLGEVLQTVKGSHAFSFIQGTPVQRAPATFTDKEQAKKEFATFVTKKDFDGINKVCGEEKTVMSIRETGPDSIIRLDEGKANPKPHTVESKSVKPKSFGDAEQQNEIATLKTVGGVPLKDIEGYVGYWGPGQKSGKLAGLTTTLGTDKSQNDHIKKLAEEELVELEEIKTQTTMLKDEPALLSSAFELEGEKQYHIKLDQIQKVKKYLPNTWEKLLYTGDYDINEMYEDNGNLMLEPNRQAAYLTALNHEITPGTTAVTADETTKLLNPVDSRNRFQHADQATYKENFDLEKAAGMHAGEEAVESLLDTEEGAIAWFNRGTDWWKSSGFADHVNVRNTLKVHAPDRGNWKAVQP